jgi:excisionase family DNA binding protein
MNKSNEEILSLKEAAEFLKLSVSCMYKKTSSKQIPHYVPGGKRVYFKKSDLENWILSHKVDSINEVDSDINDYLNRTAKIQIS